MGIRPRRTETSAQPPKAASAAVTPTGGK